VGEGVGAGVAVNVRVGVDDGARDGALLAEDVGNETASDCPSLVA